MMPGQMSQKIPSVIAGRIQSHPEAQGHHLLLCPDHNEEMNYFS